MAFSGMDEKVFRDTLPEEFICKCGAIINALHWYVARFDRADWMGVCVSSCGSCPWVHVAAAGSSDAAHQESQKLRSQLLKRIGK